MNALSFPIFFALASGVLLFSRNRAAVCLLIGTLYLGVGANLDFAGLNLPGIRVLSYLCLLRVIFRSELPLTQLGRVDKTLFVLYAFTTAILIARADESFVYRLARFFDVISAYVAFRAFIRTPMEFRWLLSVLGYLLVPYVAILAIESATRNNLFELVGAESKNWLRGDRVRCFGTFRHPSLLGSVGACFFPLFVALAWDVPRRRLAILGAFLCVAVVVLSSSGGPLSVLTVAVAGWLLWPIRTRMQLFRRGLAAFIAVMAMLMQSPIWYLLARISSITGGTGWHRSYLMDVAFRDFGRWWLVGMPISETRGWLPYVVAGTGGADITNQFIAFGLSAGILAIILFVLLLVRAFSFVGQALARVRKRTGEDADEALLWGLGVSLAAHVSNWLGITYFDQFSVLWLLQLAALVTLSEHCLQNQPAVSDTLSSSSDGPASNVPFLSMSDWNATQPQRS